MRKISADNNQQGQSLVEMAVITVVLLVLVAGIFDLGRAIFMYLSMRDAAQEGASYASIVFDKGDDPASINTKCNDIETRTSLNVDDPSFEIPDLAVYPNYFEENGVTVSLGGVDCKSASISLNACAGNEASVTVDLPLPVTMPFIGTIIGSQTITLEATATDTIIRPYCH